MTFRGLAALTTSTATASAISAITSIIAARLLSPVGFGVWQSARLVQQYGLYASLGVGMGMHRHLPMVIERAPDDDGAQRTTVNTAFSFATLMAGVAAIAVMAVGPFVSDSIPGYVFYLLGGVIITQQLVILSDQLATSLGRYGVSSVANLATSIAGLVLGIVGMLAFGVGGLLLSQICWAVLGIVMIIWPLQISLRPVLQFGVLRDLVATGTASIGNGLIFLGFKSLDRIAILALLGTVALGYYGFALAAASLIEMIFQPIGRVTLQRSAAVYERTRDLLTVWQRVTRILIGQMIVFSAVAGICVLWLPVVVRFILPDYEPAQTAASILLFGMVVFSLRSTLVYYHLATGKLIHTYPLQLVLLAIGAAVLWGAMERYPSITTAAIAGSSVYAVTSISFAIYSLRMIDASAGFIAGSILSLILPVTYTAAVTFALLQVMTNLDVFQGSIGLVLASVLFSLVFVVLQIPLLIFAERKTRLVSEVASLLQTMLARGRNDRMSSAAGEARP